MTVAEQLGHTEAAFSMSVYAKAVKRRERLPAGHLKAFDQALSWADVGRIGETAPAGLAKAPEAEAAHTASESYK